ncbi:hypothetical protein QBC47DRAFT_378006 [Echria macrotheca]|uniref:Transmembrane protein n=1 Tax=Echria macrotheca TaxID=438768 RepID=A0AAJ0F6J0_9PEZI|nr:hypothetical protein QBC47DRAFT_378006 [Echria macrotheca]
MVSLSRRDVGREGGVGDEPWMVTTDGLEGGRTNENMARFFFWSRFSFSFLPLLLLTLALTSLLGGGVLFFGSVSKCFCPAFYLYLRVFLRDRYAVCHMRFHRLGCELGI